MHIMEGYLPPMWCAIWFIIAIPFIYLGVKKVIELVREQPEHKMTIALSGAFIFMLSSMKLPSVTGSSSHPTGVGLSTVLYGVMVTSFLALIVLVFQAILLNHGGLTTLGANVFSMGIAGPALGFGVWFILRSKNVSVPVAMFFAAALADLFTYVVTAIQLTLAHGSADYLTAFTEFMTVFTATQVPLAIVEGILFAIFADFVYHRKSHFFDGNAAPLEA